MKPQQGIIHWRKIDIDVLKSKDYRSCIVFETYFDSHTTLIKSLWDWGIYFICIFWTYLTPKILFIFHYFDFSERRIQNSIKNLRVSFFMKIVNGFQLSAVHYFGTKLHLICVTMFWICLWSCLNRRFQKVRNNVLVNTHL